jgi:hypothetical protein
LEISNIFATIFQGAVLVSYLATCFKVWRSPGRFQRFRYWLPLGYPVVVLVTNLILLAVALTRGYL